MYLGYVNPIKKYSIQLPPPSRLTPRQFGVKEPQLPPYTLVSATNTVRAKRINRDNDAISKNKNNVVSYTDINT